MNKCDLTLIYLQKLIKYTRKSLLNLKSNNKIKNICNTGLKEIVHKLESIQNRFSNLSPQNNQVSPEEIGQTKIKIAKLANLYKYLKKGAIHAFIRNQVLRRIVNMNLSIMNNTELKKNLFYLKSKKDLLNQYNHQINKF